jgi:HSP20 family protein
MARRKQSSVDDNAFLGDDMDGLGLEPGFLEEEFMEIDYVEPAQQPITQSQAQQQQGVGMEELEPTSSGNGDQEEDALLPVDLFETEDRLILKARVSGVKKTDLDIAIDKGVVTISGVLSSADSEDITQYHLQECYWGRFYREVTLPVPVKENDESIDATLDDGVLTLVFIKEKIETAKRIKIS